jgi:hypothetical protein
MPARKKRKTTARTEGKEERAKSAASSGSAADGDNSACNGGGARRWWPSSEQSVPRLLSMKGELVALLGDVGTTTTVTFPDSQVFRATVGASKLVLSRVEAQDEDASHDRAKTAVQDEISKRQQDIEALKQQQQDILQRINAGDPDLADELGVLIAPLGAQVGVHTKRVRELQARRVVRFQCTEVKETLEMEAGQWFKIDWWRDPVMFVHPGASEPAVVVLKPTVETTVVTKIRPVGGGTVFAVGGLDINNAGLSSVERYDESKDKWQVVASMRSKRYGLGVCVLDGRMYAVGGMDGNVRLSSVERYDEGKDEWEVVAASMGTARGYCGATSCSPPFEFLGTHELIFGAVPR